MLESMVSCFAQSPSQRMFPLYENVASASPSDSESRNEWRYWELGATPWAAS